MATNPAQNAGFITMEQFEEAENVLVEMKRRANDAGDAGNTILMGLYNKLVKLVTPEIHRLRNRLDREDLAAFNRREKELRKAERDAKEAANVGA